jgi:hypothetical protein
MATSPDTLNAAFELLGDRLNRVGDTADDTARGLLSAVNAAISDWQDWYWGNLDQWPLSQLPAWEARYHTALSQLVSLESAHGKRELPAPSEPSGPVAVLKDLLVTANRPWWYYALYGAGGVLALKLASRFLK